MLSYLYILEKNSIIFNVIVPKIPFINALFYNHEMKQIHMTNLDLDNTTATFFTTLRRLLFFFVTIEDYYFIIINVK
jgi:hypothetical protein